MISVHDVRAQLATHGFTVLPAGAVPEHALADPWKLVESLVGERPVVVERQPIRPVAHGRSFASSDVFTPLHTDSQDCWGAAPALQLMFCQHAAHDGGASLLVDGWALLHDVERDDPALFADLFTVSRTIPFYFGDVIGPTVAVKGGALVLTSSPMPARDDVGARFAPWLARHPPREVRVRTHEVLLVDNHRMLHGRRAFTDPQRAFLRVLAWLPTPLSQPTHLLEVARGHQRETQTDLDGDRRLRVVLELLSGVPPSKLAAREGIAEAELYRWRNVALRVSAQALREPSR